jgi:pyruvate formate-lyase/glycerol dehydratase family glycyl radical enzyme
MSSIRIEKLKNQLLSMPPAICSDRERILTKADEEYQSFPTPLKRAKILQKILNEMPIAIYDNELLVGNMASDVYKSMGLFFEMSIETNENELDRYVQRFAIDDHSKEELRALIPYWKEKTVESYARNLIPEDTRKVLDSGNCFNMDLHLQNGLGHILADYKRVLDKGFLGIRQEIEDLRKKIDKSKDIMKIKYLEASSICCNAAINFAERYSRLAEELSIAEKDDTRRKELAKIAGVCKRVPAYPAANFHEALQSFLFVQLLMQIETDGTGVSPGRFDQYMYPFLKSDFEKQELSQDQALELVECLWIKFNQILKLWDEESALFFGGFPMSQNLMLGGQTPEGKDATNDLSYICLQALEELKLPQPALSVRFHPNTPDEFSKRVAEIVKLGTGMPAIFNDDVIMPALVDRGFNIHEARDYGIIGCVEMSVPGKDWPRSGGSLLNLLKPLELVLHAGKCGLTYEQVGPDTGSIDGITNFDELLKRYFIQLDFLIEHMVIIDNIIDTAHREKAPLPFVSLLIDDCIERATDVTAGGARFNATGVIGTGLANVVDSLAVIKKMVFDDKRLNLNHFVKILDQNFENHELFRQECLKISKYGNDSFDVDEFATIVVNHFVEVLSNYTNTAGGKFQAEFASVSANVPLGKKCAASPDGRLAKTPLAEGISPEQGKDLNGPSAVAHSITCFDHSLIKLGTLLNIKFSPGTLKGASGTALLQAFIKSLFELKALHVQFNIIDRQTLFDAQKHPENYRNLVVRVAGYSAFFNDLSPDIQNDIISRTEHLL